MKTYLDLCAKLRAANMDRLLGELQDAVRAEAHALLDVRARQARKVPKVVNAAAVDAENFYAEEIWARIDGDNPPLTPDDVLHYRRKAVAWAIAAKIRRAEAK